MTIRRAEDGTIVLEGDCSADDADALAQGLVADGDAAIDWRGCERAHTAVVQLLLAAGRVVKGPPRGVFLRTWVQPSLPRSYATPGHHDKGTIE